MKRIECTHEAMTAKGWTNCNGVVESQVLEALKMVRNGAEVRRTREPAKGTLYIREVADDQSDAMNTYYPRYHSESYYIEYMEVKTSASGFAKIMSKETIVRSYKTPAQCYVGD